MKVLEIGNPTVICKCPTCNSKLELEKGDLKWCKDNTGTSVPYVTCPICSHSIDCEGMKGIYKLY